MKSVHDILDNLEHHFKPENADGLDLVFQFDIEDGDNYHLIIKDKTCSLGQGAHESPSVTLIMDTETLNGIVSGETDGMQAFMMGKLRTEGDMMLATKLSELFTLAPSE